MGFLAPLFDLVFPDRCVNCGAVGSYFCSSCLGKISEVNQQICPDCKRASSGGVIHPLCRRKYGLDGLASGFYHLGPMKKATHLLKYQLITHLQETLVEKLLLSLENQQVNFKDFLVVPIPLHSLKEKKRGFNQAQIIAEPLAKRWGLELNTNFLKRVKNTATQVGLTEKERQENLTGAFEVMGKAAAKTVLVDDVFTTGATMLNAAQVLKRAGATQVWALTLARAQRY